MKYTPAPNANAEPIEVALEAIVREKPSPAVMKVLPNAILESVIKFSPSSKSLEERLFWFD